MIRRLAPSYLGLLVVIGGPRFSSRAESQWHQAAGWSVVGMTGMPEASIARELAMCFATACLITDNDAGVEGGESVTHEEVMRVFADNIEHLKTALRQTISLLPAPEPDDTAQCPCRRVLDGQDLPRLYQTAEDPDGDFDGAVADQAVVDEAWESWRAEVAFAEKWTEEHSLDVFATLGDHGQISLRELLVHMIEEYARHNGHADLLRECVDGRIGQ